MFANTNKNLIAGILLSTMMVACSTVEKVILPRASAQRVVVQQDYIGFEQIHELNEFSASLAGKSAQDCAARIAEREAAFAADSNVVNRFKLALILLRAGENQENYHRVLSLFDDSAKVQLQANEYWVFFGDLLKYQAATQIKVVESNRRLLDERTGVLAENEALKKELAVREAALGRVEQQLNALKSIEESILERDIGEENGKP